MRFVQPFYLFVKSEVSTPITSDRLEMNEQFSLDPIVSSLRGLQVASLFGSVYAHGRGIEMMSLPNCNNRLLFLELVAL